jgi:hypothetical protein
MGKWERKEQRRGEKGEGGRGGGEKRINEEEKKAITGRPRATQLFATAETRSGFALLPFGTTEQRCDFRDAGRKHDAWSEKH